MINTTRLIGLQGFVNDVELTLYSTNLCSFIWKISEIEIIGIQKAEMKVDETPEKMPRESMELFFFFGGGGVEIRNFVQQNPNPSMGLEIEKDAERELGQNMRKFMLKTKTKTKIYVDSIPSPRWKRKLENVGFSNN